MSTQAELIERYANEIQHLKTKIELEDIKGNQSAKAILEVLLAEKQEILERIERAN